MDEPRVLGESTNSMNSLGRNCQERYICGAKSLVQEEINIVDEIVSRSLSTSQRQGVIASARRLDDEFIVRPRAVSDADAPRHLPVPVNVYERRDFQLFAAVGAGMEKLHDIFAPVQQLAQHSRCERARVWVSPERTPKQPNTGTAVRIRLVVEYRCVVLPADGRRANPAGGFVVEAEARVVLARVVLKPAVRNVRDASVTTREGDAERALTCVGGRRRVQGRRVLRRKRLNLDV